MLKILRFSSNNKGGNNMYMYIINSIIEVKIENI